MRLSLLLFLIAMSLLLTTVTTTVSQGVVSLCRANEQVFFNCTAAANGKLISLCASKRLTATNGYLQYRFGKVSAIELQFPEKLEGSQKEFRHDHYFRARVDRSDVIFKTGGYEYTIFDDWEGDIKPEFRNSGVSVMSLSNQQNHFQINCRVRRVIRLVALEDIVPALEPSVLNPQ